MPSRGWASARIPVLVPLDVQEAVLCIPTDRRLPKIRLRSRQLHRLLGQVGACSTVGPLARSLCCGAALLHAVCPPRRAHAPRPTHSRPSQRLVLRLDGWEQGSHYPHGHLVRSLGPINSLTYARGPGRWQPPLALAAAAGTEARVRV